MVPSLRAAQKAVAAGVDGLVVEGGEGGGFKSTRPVSTFVLLPQVCDAFDLPVIAAGGSSTACRWRPPSPWGPEGVQMGTRMVSAAESPVHENYKRLVTEADATDTVVLSAHSSPAYRVMRTPLQRGARARAVGRHGTDRRYGGRPQALFRGGSGRRASPSAVRRPDGLIEVLPVRQIVHETVRDFYGVVAALGRFAPGT